MDNNTKKLVIIAVSVFVLIIFGLVAILSGRDKPDDNTGLPENAEVTIDKDTGDEIVRVPGKDKEQFLSDEPMILGGDDLLDKTSLTYDQYGLIVEIVTNYAKNNVGKVSTIKFLPNTIKGAPINDPADYLVQVKTVDPENILNVGINMLGLDRVQVFITNTTKPNIGAYDSGIVPDPNSHGEEDVEGDVGEEQEHID